MKSRVCFMVTVVAMCLALLASSCTRCFTPPPSITSPSPYMIPPSSTALIATAILVTPTATLGPNPQDIATVEGNDSTMMTEVPEFTRQITLVEKTSPMTVVRAIEWQADSSALHYALGYGLADEPKDWVWWHYDLNTGAKESLPAPASHVPDAVRAELGLCVEPDLTCWSEATLFESPSGTQMAYGPIGSQGFEQGNGELWIANVDGTARRLVPAFLPGIVEWSPSEDFLLVDAAWSEWPETFLVQAHDLSVNRLLDLVGMENCKIPHARPHFSPDGNKIAFIGKQPRGETMACFLWEIDMDGGNPRKLSEHVGGIQWLEDSQGLYVLEHQYTSRNTQEFALYRVYTHSSLPQVELLYLLNKSG